MLLEALLQAAIGLLAGLGIYAALIPALGGLHVDGVRIGAAALVLPWWAIALCVAALLGTAGPAAAAGLRRVSITPLAVRTRRDIPAMGTWRVILPVLMVLAALLGGRAVLMIGGGEVIVAVIISAVMFGVPMLAMSLLNPWAISLSARRMHRSAQTPERLLAARMPQEDPRAAWRQLQSVVLLAFVAVTVGAGLTVIGTADGEPGVEHLVEDMRTGALLTVLYGFFAAACAVLIDQAAAGPAGHRRGSDRDRPVAHDRGRGADLADDSGGRRRRARSRGGHDPDRPAGHAAGAAPSCRRRACEPVRRP